MVERLETLSKKPAKIDKPTISIDYRHILKLTYLPFHKQIGATTGHILLDSCQRAYAHRILSLFDSIPTKEFPLITFYTEDRNAQPEDLPEYDSILSTA